MFCPSCGSEERQMSQFCRACGTNLQPVRLSIARPDTITASAASAREEIGRAVAEKIREVENARDLKRVAEDVLPQIEKFLESPEEKRLRRMRSGVVIAAIGLGSTLVGLIMSVVLSGKDTDSALMVAAMGIVALAIGLGLVLNGFLFSTPRKSLQDHSSDARSQTLLDGEYVPPQLATADRPDNIRGATTSNLSTGARSSVTEHTTHLLKTER